ncbi:MAG TPA: aerial mycelium formation protein [Acidimicrobiia bacterium]|nr:aerial mycelium formation protein [Acidimicrobiia bacterium]
MSQTHTRRADVLVEPAFLEGLDAKDLEALRAMHAECSEVETEVSYVRRLAQARIDIVRAELDRRAAGGSVGDLISALPQILADAPPRPEPATSRLPRHLGPAPAIEWSRGLEYLISDSTLMHLPGMAEEELRENLDLLRRLEVETSERRRQLHGVIDRLEHEVAARHAVDPV